MEAQNSTIVGSLDIDVWDTYLNKFANVANEYVDVSVEMIEGVNVVRESLDVIEDVLERNKDTTALLIYWPIELYSLFDCNVVLDEFNAVRLNEPVSKCVSLKRKFKNRLNLVNALHLFPEFITDSVPTELRAKQRLFDVNSFYRYLVASERVTEFSDYTHDIATLQALESNPNHSILRRKVFDKITIDCEKEFDDAKELNLECQTLREKLSSQSEEKILVSKELEYLKQQVLLLQEALETQHSKIFEITKSQSTAFEEQKAGFLEDIESLRSGLVSEQEKFALENKERLKLKGIVSEKQKLIENLNSRVSHEAELNSQLQEQLVEVQIHIEKTHERFLSQLRDADSKYVSEKNKALDIQNKLKSAQEKSEKLAKDLIKSNDAVKKQESLIGKLETLEQSFKKTEKRFNEKTALLTQQLEESSSKLAAKTKALLQESMQKQRIEQKLTSKLENTQQALTVSEARRNILEFEFSQLKNSKYWKLLSPAKNIKDRVFGTGNNLKEDMALLYTSNLFDSQWYLNCYKDVVDSGLDPAQHYLQFGYKEGRQPGPHFDGNWYLKHYSDVASKGMNPLIHFIKYGQAEGRRSSPRLLGKS